MIQNLYNLAAKWEEQGQAFHDKHANEHPVQAQNARGLMRLCAGELKEALDKMKGEQVGEK
jgi:hypothetical protein